METKDGEQLSERGSNKLGSDMKFERVPGIELTEFDKPLNFFNQIEKQGPNSKMKELKSIFEENPDVLLPEERLQLEKYLFKQIEFLKSIGDAQDSYVLLAQLNPKKYGEQAKKEILKDITNSWKNYYVLGNLKKIGLSEREIRNEVLKISKGFSLEKFQKCEDSVECIVDIDRIRAIVGILKKIKEERELDRLNRILRVYDENPYVRDYEDSFNKIRNKYK